MTKSHIQRASYCFLRSEGLVADLVTFRDTSFMNIYHLYIREVTSLHSTHSYPIKDQPTAGQ
ncbi:hypothetical protein KCTCHS21_29040 [Cohnella abietis]|uniref:Uncharacterized protein n=1 Tax=Cohnella abietis TaxID=2507935 RepID=A0A3T1D625_9BACL|nr:hypothetical protein KCTCHS21_29040 [Cohnella abietis]